MAPTNYYPLLTKTHVVDTKTRVVHREHQGTFFRPKLAFSRRCYTGPPPLGPDLPEISNAHNHCESQLQMSKDGLYTDMVAQCLNDSGDAKADTLVNFHLHRLVMCSQSEYFRGKISYTNSSEGECNEQGAIIVKLDNIPASAFGIIRDFMYTGKCEIPPEHVANVMIGADYLGIEPLFLGTIHCLIKSPLNAEAVNLCNLFSSKIPEDVKTFIADYRAWNEREEEYSREQEEEWSRRLKRGPPSSDDSESSDSGV